MDQSLGDTWDRLVVLVAENSVMNSYMKFVSPWKPVWSGGKVGGVTD